ncbi:type I methionyl aminopeptidase [Paenibacillus sp. ACRRX]|uniref:type I methionyl aminopeptidase n=1 Tax=unclassified Paenibacillus TaxID=185978 RepID=UPI001EF501D1|nr:MULTISPECIES: type I methionyl aminopeptidase [unclassified Paenibacillus]MCG7408618.1 type I methionyl aminopeptidase [Paenibacillus sp. ACRRX]MDK8182863.1 type I methionyl aminopeptidase [Paenibacillus sp. UMB4589-SE434]
MLELKNAEQIAKIQAAGRLAARCHREVASRLAPGVTTKEIDAFVEKWLLREGGYPYQKGYNGFPYSICASRNDIVCHGFPTSIPLLSGDIVTIDLVVQYKGWLADLAWTYNIGRVRPEVKALVRHTLKALRLGMEKARPGGRVGDISNAIGTYGRLSGYGVVQTLVGHGIGRQLHEAPEVPNEGSVGTGDVLEDGLVITLEPIFTMGGNDDVWLGRDGWTVRTMNGQWAAHFEHTIAVTKQGPRILTTAVSPLAQVSGFSSRRLRL